MMPALHIPSMQTRVAFSCFCGTIARNVFPIHTRVKPNVSMMLLFLLLPFPLFDLLYHTVTQNGVTHHLKRKKGRRESSPTDGLDSKWFRIPSTSNKGFSPCVTSQEKNCIPFFSYIGSLFLFCDQSCARVCNPSFFFHHRTGCSVGFLFFGHSRCLGETRRTRSS